MENSWRGKENVASVADRLRFHPGGDVEENVSLPAPTAGCPKKV